MPNAAWRLRAAMSLAILAALPGGCATATFRSVCPPLPEYTEARQARAAEQYQRLERDGSAPDLLGLVDDYGSLRAQCRTIRGQRSEVRGQNSGSMSDLRPPISDI